MGLEFTVSALIPAAPEDVFDAWLDSKQHSDMTGGNAEISDRVGDSFKAWDGYISGKNQELLRPSRILQSWRTSDFSDGNPDSILEINFHLDGDQTRITIQHSNLPDHGLQYKKGWVDAYFTPMKEFFKD